MFDGKSILITGGTGFVGSHMIDYILWNEVDCKIYAIDLALPV